MADRLFRQRVVPNKKPDFDSDNWNDHWYCDSCQVEVYTVGCKHCGKDWEDQA